MSADAVQQRRRARLADAVEKAGGKAALGRLLGYKDGAFVGQMLRGERPVTEDTVSKLESKHGFRGWFSASSALEAEVYAVLASAGLDPTLLSGAPSLESELPDWLRSAHHTSANVRVSYVPDVIVRLPGGKVVFIEVKSARVPESPSTAKLREIARQHPAEFKLVDEDTLSRVVDELKSLHEQARAESSNSADLSPAECDLLRAFRMLPEDEQNDLVRDVMARAEHYHRVVERELAKRGIAVNGFVPATRAAEVLPPAPPAREQLLNPSPAPHRAKKHRA